MTVDEKEPKQPKQFCLDLEGQLAGHVVQKKEEEEEFEVDVTTYLKYFGLTEDPTQGRDYVHTPLVDRLVGLVKCRRSIRMLGEAGIGKTATIRELKERLEKDPEETYVVPVIQFRPLVDTNDRYITRDGLAALSLYVIKELNKYFIRKHKKQIMSGTEENIRVLRDTKNKNIGPAVRTFYLEDLFEKISQKDIKIVIVLEDADSLQWFDNFDHLNYLTSMVHSVIFSYKPSEEKASKEDSLKKGKDETNEERKARKQRKAAFWRRSSAVPIPGQPANVLYHIMYGKISKRIDLLTDEAIAYGFKAAYSDKAPSADKIDAYMNGLRPNQPLYNPDKIGHFLAHCLEIGYLKRVEVAPGCIDARIAELACRKTIANLDAYDMVDLPTLDVHMEELKLAKEKLKETASQPN